MADLAPPDPEEELRRLHYQEGLFPSGHFYHPSPQRDAIPQILSRTQTLGNALSEVRLNDARQLHLLDVFRSFADDLPFPVHERPDCRYYYENPFFSYGDAISLYGMLRYLQPRKLIEIGSGFSSAVTLETNDRFLDGRVECVFIEPFEDRLRNLMHADDSSRHRVIEEPVQDVSLDEFRSLQSGDILFVDSSHVVKFGSDVAQIFREILPILSAGVYIHFHDIFYPFEYPPDWLYEGRYWNECYFLQAYLANNSLYRIQLFNDYLGKFHREALNAVSPLYLDNPGGSIWLRKSLSAE